MGKKRKNGPAPSSTLLHFFAKNDSETPENPPVKKTKNSSSNVKVEQDEREVIVSVKEERDVIVIDSDDETQTGCIDIASSSDVEVLELIEPTNQKHGKAPTSTAPQPLQAPALSLSHRRREIWDETESTAVDDDSSGVESEMRVEDGIAKAMRVVGTKIRDDGSTYTAPETAEESDMEADMVKNDDDEPRICPVCGSVLDTMEDGDFEKHVNGCLDDPPLKRSPTPDPFCITFESQLRQVQPIPSSSKQTAFSLIMSGKSERERAAWVEAQKAEDRSFRPTKNQSRQAPFYKILTGMPIAVDAFRYGYIPGVNAYFLTHAHSDHYTNLSSNWKGKPIYCSETTANLIVHMLSVDRECVRPLPMNIPVVIPNTGGVKVTLIDANHCPGSCLFLFEGPQTVNAGDSTYRSQHVGSNRMFRYLHCGDFRACPQHILHPQVKGRKIDAVYLDTTYLNPKYCFPPQPLVIDACAELARRIVRGESTAGSSIFGAFQKWINSENGKGKQKEASNGETLVVVGTYTIGKERIVKAIAKALNTQVFCDSRKTAVLRCEDDPELHALLTDKPLEAGVHVVALGQVASDRFKEYMARWKDRWTRAVAFRPTGWTYSPPAGSDTMPSIASVVANAQSRTFTYADLKPARNSTPTLMQYGVPYSEHSSFVELACFAVSVDCAKVIATVNVGSATGRAKMQKWIEKWDAERKKRRDADEPAIVKFRSMEYW